LDTAEIALIIVGSVSITLGFVFLILKTPTRSKKRKTRATMPKIIPSKILWIVRAFLAFATIWFIFWQHLYPFLIWNVPITETFTLPSINIPGYLGSGITLLIISIATRRTKPKVAIQKKMEASPIMVQTSKDLRGLMEVMDKLQKWRKKYE
jgi:lysylphosphatidylglycerol synthetase-like protein (DUF2156 family)